MAFVKSTWARIAGRQERAGSSAPGADFGDIAANADHGTYRVNSSDRAGAFTGRWNECEQGRVLAARCATWLDLCAVTFLAIRIQRVTGQMPAHLRLVKRGKAVIAMEYVRPSACNASAASSPLQCVASSVHGGHVGKPVAGHADGLLPTSPPGISCPRSQAGQPAHGPHGQDRGP